ncbi:MAG: 50S ribosome-binding GTPase, partial [Deferribacteraceae bacterium]|nr:50S ribosome-binding GTPase [Deferribacteraceae bacterium]
TTRDILTRTICLKGVEFILTDTAGLRETESAAEREGVLRAKEALKSADLILWLVSPEDIAEDPTALAVPLTDVKNTVIVGSKADLCIENSSCKERSVDVQVSAKTGFGMDKLKEIIGKRLELAQTGGIDLITDRQYEEAVNAVKELDNAILSPTLDIAAFSVKRGAEYIKDIGGREVSEAVLDAVFSRFCIGK